ncbi:hypothetical protein DSECCO2_615150 [anaerobic digester metagenome]
MVSPHGFAHGVARLRIELQYFIQGVPQFILGNLSPAYNFVVVFFGKLIKVLVYQNKRQRYLRGLGEAAQLNHKTLA